MQTWMTEFEPVASAVRPRRARGFYLWWGDDRLVLYKGSDAHGVCLQPLDFERRAKLRGELARACGVTVKHRPRVLDVMAGLGVDGMTMSTLGCAVVMVERHPVLWALLDSFVRLVGEQHTVVREVVHADAWSWLQAANAVAARFDVVYLDPMFPSRRKGALPGKPMQFLSELTEPDSHPVEDWIELVRQHARERVVLKRRLRGPVVGKPDWQIKGRSVRYDVYRGAQH